MTTLIVSNVNDFYYSQENDPNNTIRIQEQIEILALENKAKDIKEKNEIEEKNKIILSTGPGESERKLDIQAQNRENNFSNNSNKKGNTKKILSEKNLRQRQLNKVKESFSKSFRKISEEDLIAQNNMKKLNSSLHQHKSFANEGEIETERITSNIPTLPIFAGGESEGYEEEDEGFKHKIFINDGWSERKKYKENQTSEQTNINMLIKGENSDRGQEFCIQNEKELKEILFGSFKSAEYNYKLRSEIKTVGDQQIEVLNEDDLVILLEYLYCELHPGLIELSDTFVEERRKYFKVDNETYIQIIYYFLKKKEEFFLCVLSEVMTKLNISQAVLDASFHFYMNVENEKENPKIEVIKSTYDKVYHAGLR